MPFPCSPWAFELLLWVPLSHQAWSQLLLLSCVGPRTVLGTQPQKPFHWLSRVPSGVTTAGRGGPSGVQGGPRVAKLQTLLISL